MERREEIHREGGGQRERCVVMIKGRAELEELSHSFHAGRQSGRRFKFEERGKGQSFARTLQRSVHRSAMNEIEGLNEAHRN